MYLHKLTLTNFKNYQQADYQFSEKINCIVGNNGAGKTNLLDAIYYLSFCKSFFNQSDTQNIRHGEDFFAIHSSWFRNSEKPDQVQCIQQKGQRKKFSLNKKEYNRLADHIGLFPLVMISPYDRDLINDGSEIRRKYIDGVISQLDRVYLDYILEYHKALAQRNALLRSFSDNRYFDQETLDIWDEQMISLGEKIYRKRADFFIRFIPLFQYFFSYITDGLEQVGLTYQSQLVSGNFREQIRDAVTRDRQLQFSTVGVHKDDVDFLLDSFPIKRYGSQGQQKSFVIAIKLAQFEYIRKIKGFKPLLLLDDVFDKLDDNRISKLIRLVSENSFGQVFITDTQEENIRKIFDPLDIEHMIFRIKPDESIKRL